MAQLVRNILSGYVTRFASIISDLILLPVIAARLGAVEWGIYLLIISTAHMFLLGDLGMGNATVRYSAAAYAREDSDGINRVINTGLGFYLISSLIVAIAFIGGMVGTFERFADVQMSGEIASVIILAGLSNIVFGMILSVYRNLIIGFQRYDVANLLRFGQVFFRTLGIILVLQWGGQLVSIAIVDAVSVLVFGLVALVYSRRMFPNMSIRFSSFDSALLREMLPYSLQVSALGFMSVLITQSGNWIVGVSVGIIAVPVYTVGYRLYHGVKELIAAISLPLVPDAARAASTGDFIHLSRMFIYGTKLVNVISCLVFVPLMILADIVIKLWMGPGFEDSVPIARLLLFCGIINNLHLIPMSLMQGGGRIGKFVIYHACWAGASIALGLILGSEMGLMGVALGMALPIIFLEPLYLRTSIQTFHINVRVLFVDAIGRPLLLGLVLASVTLAVMEISEISNPVSRILAVGMYAVIYMILMYRFGLRDGEAKSVRAIANKVLPVAGSH